MSLEIDSLPIIDIQLDMDTILDIYIYPRYIPEIETISGNKWKTPCKTYIN